MAGRLREGPGEINAALAPDERAVRAALDGLRSGLIADGGNVELVKVDEGWEAAFESAIGEAASAVVRAATRRPGSAPAADASG